MVRRDGDGLGASYSRGRLDTGEFRMELGARGRGSGDGIPDEMRGNDWELHGVGDGERSVSAVDAISECGDGCREVFLRSECDKRFW